MNKGHPAAAITGLGIYLPAKILSNHDLEKMVDTSDEWIKQRTGISQRRIAESHETTFTMAYEAGKNALKMAKLRPEEIDLVICATLIPEHPFPSTASLVQAALGATKAGAFDLEAACAGFVYALGVARAFIHSGMARVVLVIGSETMSRVVDWEDRSTCVLFGDGAGAAIVQASFDEKAGAILEVALKSDGSKADCLIIPAGGSRYPTTENTVRDKLHFLRMNGAEVFKAAVRAMADTTLEALKHSDLQLSDLNLMIAHQANSRIIDAVQKRLELPDGISYQNLERYGNTSSASIPLALYDAMQEGRLKQGMYLAVAGFGGGFSWGATIIKWGLNPEN
ncbi:MAG: ketoacyl-ACP synthase III [Chloroflexi bacterium]|uniref:Beta-ketoacyl-[acyl-carrier-protein] synthase III n=1 Tax=Candidatus Chlorohelix allophototropha TaxID=3003348 RepID=A0A8T7LQL2_9CHLR|nr:ketoacyl-ACP synthase III [Chloroflexota bacterium]WJW66198.1 ketoacyl-ACP synthase III [Chloroflexota bacterium L227-S17]